MNNTNPNWIKSILKNSHLSPQKKFGQNFLQDHTVVDTMLEVATLNLDDIVVEIGPGLGALTTVISPQVEKTLAVEYDREMALLLNNILRTEKCSNVEILNQDILDFNPADYQLQNTNYKLIGSIPYQITSPLIHKIINWKEKPCIVVLMIQKEVAEKLSAKPPKASYFSNLISAFGKIEIIKIVQPHSFHPAPKVDSAIVKLEFFEAPSNLNPQEFSKFLHHGFKNPRKMLNKVFEKKLLRQVAIDPQQRPENLSLDDWMKLYSTV